LLTTPKKLDDNRTSLPAEKTTERRERGKKRHLDAVPETAICSIAAEKTLHNTPHLKKSRSGEGRGNYALIPTKKCPRHSKVRKQTECHPQKKTKKSYEGLRSVISAGEEASSNVQKTEATLPSPFSLGRFCPDG